MRKKLFVLLAVIMVLSLMMIFVSCETKQITLKQETVEKAALNVLLDRFNSSFNANDAATMASYLTEDVLFCGTDPSEILNKQQITDLWTQMFAEFDPEINLISEREIKVAYDGNCAIVVCQYMFPMFTPKIPWRNVSHTVKINGKWKINFFSASFIPKNEDIPKLNAALE